MPVTGRHLGPVGHAGRQTDLDSQGFTGVRYPVAKLTESVISPGVEPAVAAHRQSVKTSCSDCLPTVVSSRKGDQ